MTLLTLWPIRPLGSLEALLAIATITPVEALAAILTIPVCRSRAAVLPIATIESLVPLTIGLAPGEALVALARIGLTTVSAIMTEALVALAEIATAIAVLPIASAAVAITIARRTLIAVALIPALALGPVLPGLSRLEHAGLRLIGAHTHLRLFAASILAVLTGLAVERLSGNLERAMPWQSAVHPLAAALLDLLLAVSEDDAIVVLGVLQVVLGQHMVAR